MTSHWLGQCQREEIQTELLVLWAKRKAIEISKYTGIPHSTVCDYRKGKHFPGPERLALLMEMLNDIR